MAGLLKKITAWSWSRLQTYELCPQKFKYSYVDGIQEPKNNAMMRGSAIHEMAEKYVVKGGVLKPELKLYEKLFKEVRDLKKLKHVEIHTEQQVALSEKWEAAPWFEDKRNPAAPKPWVRIVVDLQIVDHKEKKARFIDHKTGKVNLEGAQQLELYAIWGFITYPDVETIDGELWFLDQLMPNRHIVTFERKDLKKLLTKWSKRVVPLFKDTKFPPRANNKCRWCYFSKAKDGPCKF